MMEDQKQATLKLKCKAKTGFESKEEHTISLEQWEDLQNVLSGGLKSPRPISVKDNLPENGSYVWAYSTWSGWIQCRFSDRNYSYGTSFPKPWFCKSDSKQYADKTITHWAHLQIPEKPVNNEVKTDNKVGRG